MIGAGPAGLMAAERLATAGIAVTVCDRMPSPARKLLMAGRGGLNLTHSEPTDRLVSRYGDAAVRLAPTLEAFPAEELRAWCQGLGVETFVGSSGRVFPISLKASPLLRAWLRRLDGLGVRFQTQIRWADFGEDLAQIVERNGQQETFDAEIVVFALGGASWPRLGGDGGWAEAFRRAGVAVSELRPSNCGFMVAWSTPFAERFAGQPLKRIGMSFEGRRLRGEAMVTAGCIEGGLVYAFSRSLREAVARDGAATVELDLRPDISIDQLAERLAAPRGKRSTSTHLAKAAGLAPVATGLLREAGPLPADAEALARRIKATPLELIGVSGLERAISTAGGVRLNEVDETFMLKRRPGIYVIGEMLDWEAPTGGYLLHACLAMGRLAGDAAARRLLQSGAGGFAPILPSTADGMSS
ncbi:TIGR03862 family flavoprotein [Methylopila sp. M107]|uniref:NAD(P)/FAD-dependent oxidoreductase n=1 Tax=Methylopila sp. M107 TaxID=1101190 RepID=UPI00320461D3